jgi:hypothetical protein
MPSSALAPPAVEAPRRRPAWALPVVVLAVIAVAIGAVIGIRGLLGDPVRSVAADGTATLSGGYQPVACDSGCHQGYVQSGARSVFVQLPNDCAQPQSGAEITVHARPDASLGKKAYLAVDCPSH